ncbi:hypothetical protein ABI59_02150 [Acidobacteria bacterium Mor1]|nr:hypothetical protein ABI59_02150 [Acidobacteria bacterium Mor1]
MTTILALALGFAGPAVLAETEYSPIDNDDQPGGLRLNPLVEIDDSREAIEAKILSGRSAAAASTAKAENLFATAQQQEKEGDHDLAMASLQQLFAMDLPESGFVDALMVDAYLLMGRLYEAGEEGIRYKAASFYIGALNHMGPGLESLIESTANRAAELLATRGEEVAASDLRVYAIEQTGDVPAQDFGPKLDSDAPQTEDAGDDTCDAAVPVSLPSSEIMSVAFAGDKNWRSFTLSGNQTVRIETLSSDTFGDDTTLNLYGGCDGSSPTDFIEFDDDDGPGLLSLIESECLAAGTYYVEVGGFSTRTPDDFELAITETGDCIIPEPDAFEPDDEITQAQRLFLGSTGPNKFEKVQSHSIFPRGDMDFSYFDVYAGPTIKGRLIRVQTGSINPDSGIGNPDTEIGLYHEAGVLIAVNDDAGPGNLGSELEICLPKNRYFVGAMANSSNDTFVYETGAYLLAKCAAEYEPNNNFAQATALLEGEIKAGVHLSVGGNDEDDFYVLTVDEARQLEIETDGYDTFDVDTVLELYDAAGNLLDSDDDGGEGFLSRIEFTVGAGTYYVNVTNSSFDSGDSWPYTVVFNTSEPGLVEIEPNDDCASAQPVMLGDSVDAGISFVGDRDNFRLSVPAGRFVQIDTNGSSGDTVLQISDSTGAMVIGCDDDGGPGLFSEWSCCLEAGDYCVTVRDFGDNGTVNYSINFRDMGECDPTDPLDCPVNGLGCPF